MSRPPSAPPSAPGTPRPANTTPIHTIVQNLPNLFNMYEKGQLSDTQITQLRTLVHTQIRQITANSINSGRPNPLYSLPDAINPSIPYKDVPALVSREGFDAMIKTSTRALMEAKRAREQQNAAAATAAAAAAAVSSNGIPGAPAAVPAAPISRPGTPGPAATSAPVRPVGQPTPAGPSATSTPAPTPPRPRPMPSGLFTHAELTQLARLPADVRNAWLAKEPTRQSQFQASLNYWRAQPKSNFNPANRATPQQNPTNSNTGRPPQNASATTPNASATTSFTGALPDARGFALRPPPGQLSGPGGMNRPQQQLPPPEPEHVRRLRQIHAMLAQIAPGLSVEAGYEKVVEDIIERMMKEGLEGAARLAKHRNSDKVELRDMARYIDHAWEMTIPGFDAAPAHPVHVAPDKEKKRGKAVAPKASKLGGGRKEEE
ncbi:hypothetical protein I350_06308 [Cryptococcus amylolentus CBS 6273]|uniref:Transcription initiation factor TFIID subunit 12 domain-containing protein n=1 Tax=Cryptococcus amylolentus CBS 6273 TaxID=1296118 RepID=A0A1E3JKV6_9TREE|nr:hypothetical protein I350_06308 [Cryptococcus amylolentus CBS 6273]